MIRLFISYRREDTQAIAGRLCDKLQACLGRDSVFMDIDSIPPGADFRRVIGDAMTSCDVLLVLIGDEWNKADKDGKPRLENPDDFVRLEIEAALNRKIPVIPILAARAVMPKAETLPPTLRDLAYRNALDLDAGRDFHPHADRLLREVKRLGEKGSAPPVEVTKTLPPHVAPWRREIEDFLEIVGLGLWGVEDVPNPAFHPVGRALRCSFSIGGGVLAVFLWSMTSARKNPSGTFSEYLIYCVIMPVCFCLSGVISGVIPRIYLRWWICDESIGGSPYSSSTQGFREDLVPLVFCWLFLGLLIGIMTPYVVWVWITATALGIALSAPLYFAIRRLRAN